VARKPDNASLREDINLIDRRWRTIIKKWPPFTQCSSEDFEIRRDIGVVASGNYVDTREPERPRNASLSRRCRCLAAVVERAVAPLLISAQPFNRTPLRRAQIVLDVIAIATATVSRRVLGEGMERRDTHHADPRKNRAIIIKWSPMSDDWRYCGVVAFSVFHFRLDWKIGKSE